MQVQMERKDAQSASAHVSHLLLAKIEAAVKVADLSEIQSLIDQVDTPLSFV